MRQGMDRVKGLGLQGRLSFYSSIKWIFDEVDFIWYTNKDCFVVNKEDILMDSKKVLIIEDEKSISDIIKFNLEKESFDVDTAYDGQEGLEKALAGKPDLILLDVMLPLMDGFQVCKKVRETSSVPILMLTAKEEEVDKVLGLELGADDYITKPFGMRELIARIKANIRRTDLMVNLQDVPSNIQDFGTLAIDLNRYEVRKHDKALELTLREFELLKYLAERENKVFSREQLLEEVWGYEYYGDIRTVDVTVRRLREKLEDDSSDPKYIMTKRGIGYYFRRP
jgi:two-component system response regulator VicR